MRLLAGAVLFLTPASALAGQAPECGDRALLRVMVLDESGDTPIPIATVVLRWGGPDGEQEPVRAAVGPDGRLALCAPSEATRATLSAELGDASSEEVAIPIVAGRARDVNLRLQMAPVRTGQIIGRVRDAVTERPVTAAAVSLAGRAAVVETDRRGRFTLSDVPTGVREVSVRHLGYASLSHGIAVSPDITTEVEISLVPDPVQMEPLVTTATRSRRLEVKGFYERKRWGERLGTGIFLTAEDIDRWRPLEISHMVAFEAGVQLACGGSGRRGCRLISRRVSRGFTRGGCAMTVWLDGVRVGGSADEWVRPTEIAGVEVYKGAASIPGEFAGFDSRCGVVVIWTK